VELIEYLGYAGVFALMFLESTFFPFPSEVVVIPAGYLASNGKMNLSLVVISGVSGSLAGALFNYYIALKLGRELLLRIGGYFLFTEATLSRVEKFFEKHGEFSTFIGRLLPGIRQYISFPAGLAKMNLFKFCLFTALGAGIWVTILAFIGFAVGSQPELSKEYAQRATRTLILASAVLVVVYIFIKRRSR